MTVKELIEELSNYDDDQQVAIILDDVIYPAIIQDVDITYDDRFEDDDVLLIY